MTAAAMDSLDPFAGVLGCYRGRNAPTQTRHLTRNDDRGHEVADELIATGDLDQLIGALWAFKPIRSRTVPAYFRDPKHPAARVAAAAGALCPDIVVASCRYHLTSKLADGSMPTVADTYLRTAGLILNAWRFAELTAAEAEALTAPAYPSITTTLAALDRRDIDKYGLTEAAVHKSICDARIEPFRARLAHILAVRLNWGSDPVINLLGIDLNVAVSLENKCAALISAGISPDVIDESLPALDWPAIVHRAMNGTGQPYNWPVDAGGAINAPEFAARIAREGSRDLERELGHLKT